MVRLYWFLRRCLLQIFLLCCLGSGRFKISSVFFPSWILLFLWCNHCALIVSYRHTYLLRIAYLSSVTLLCSDAALSVQYFHYFFYGPSLWSSLLFCFFYFFNFFTSLLLFEYCYLIFFLILSEYMLQIFFISSLLSMSFHVPGVMHSLCSCFLKTIILSLALLDVSLAFCQCSSIFITALLKFTQGSCNLQIWT